MDCFLGEIRVMGFGFVPRGWAACNGQLLPLAQNTALFALLGTFYGGDGKSTFALPNLQGAVPAGTGQSTTGTTWQLGEAVGSATFTLQQNEMPAHNHSFNATSTTGTQTSAGGAQIANGRSGSLQNQTAARIYSPVTSPRTVLTPPSILSEGNNQPHNNMMPYLGLNVCIALAGQFPQRS